VEQEEEQLEDLEQAANEEEEEDNCAAAKRCAPLFSRATLLPGMIPLSGLMNLGNAAQIAKSIPAELAGGSAPFPPLPLSRNSSRYLQNLCHLTSNFLLFNDVIFLRFFSVADPGCLSRIQIFHPGSRGQVKKKDSGSGSASKKLFLSCRKYDPGCSSRIQILIFFIHPGSRFQGSKRHQIPDPQNCFFFS
jgi:hypothetical protein